jgi:hypothetical protein
MGAGHKPGARRAAPAFGRRWDCRAHFVPRWVSSTSSFRAPLHPRGLSFAIEDGLIQVPDLGGPDWVS